MTDFLAREFGPDDKAGIDGRGYAICVLSSIPEDHVHYWYPGTSHGVRYVECASCYATRGDLPGDEVPSTDWSGLDAQLDA